MTSKEIRNLRLQLGLTQEQLAQELGVTTSCVARWERRRNSPSPIATKALKTLEDMRK